MTERWTLYAAPMTCAMAVHAALLEAGLAPERDFEVRWVHRGPGRQIAEAEFAALNAKRRVPCLVTPDNEGGELLTEIVGILAHLDTVHGPPRSPAERRRLIEWLAFVATEFHQAILGPMFDPQSPEAAKADGAQRLLPPLLEVVAAHLETRDFVVGASPSGADYYLGWALALARFGAREAVAHPALLAYLERLSAIEGFQKAQAINLERYRALAVA